MRGITIDRDEFLALFDMAMQKQHKTKGDYQFLRNVLSKAMDAKQDDYSVSVLPIGCKVLMDKIDGTRVPGEVVGHLYKIKSENEMYLLAPRCVHSV